MKKLRVAIIGCGRISASYAIAFRELTHMAELVCAIDKDPGRAERFAAAFGCDWGTCFEDLSGRQIDAVHLCLPHYLHAPMAIRAMRSGMHVLTEKPVAMTLQEADAMKAVSEETGRKLGVIFQTRYENSVQTLRAMVRDGAFGRILSARSILTWNRPLEYYEGSDWKGTWDREGGGVLIDQAIHSIDRIRYILDDQVDWIEGSVHNHCHPFRPVEDAAEAVIHFRDGCLYSLYACNSYASDVPVYLEFIGEKGRFGLRKDTGFYETDGQLHTLESMEDSLRNRGLASPCAMTDTSAPDKGMPEHASRVPSYWGDGHARQLQDFYRSILEDRPVAIDVTEGRRTLEIVKGIYLSSLKKERICLPFEDTLYQDLNRKA